MKNLLELLEGYAYFSGLVIAGVSCIAAVVYYVFQL